jgi:hypothetical protein
MFQAGREKGKQSNREYSSKVLSKTYIRTILVCNIFKGRLYMWTVLQNARIERRPSPIED